MAAIAMTLSDLEGHFCCVKPFWLYTWGNITLLTTICSQMNRLVISTV